MSKEVRKKIDKIYNKINSIAVKGKDNIFEYYKYVDELIDKGEYGYFEQVIFYYYNIDIVNDIDVSEVKKKTWKPILFNTNSSFSSKIKKMYDNKNVYQQSYNIYTTGTQSQSILLGQVKELDTNSIQFVKYTENKTFDKLMSTRKTFLEVIKNGITTIVTNDNASISEDQNLYNRYVIAIDLLLS
jgi:hypothetical protein